MTSLLLPFLLLTTQSCAPRPPLEPGGAAPLAPAALTDAAPATTTPPLAEDHAEPPAPLARAREILASAAIQQAWQIDAESAARAHELGATEGELLALLESLAAGCLGHEEPCETFQPQHRSDSPEQETIVMLVDLLGELGTERSFSLLLRLDTRGLYRAEAARERILLRAALRTAAVHPCQPPTAEEVTRTAAGLADFFAVTQSRGRLRARRLSAAEQADLAYLLAATAGAGPAVGVTRESGSGSWIKQGPPNERRARLLEVIKAARYRGDSEALATAARSFLTSLGYPGPLRTAEAGDYGWGGARYSYVMRDLAEASELLGQFEAAAELYRRAAPGGGACATSASHYWATQVRGTIRSEEQLGRCGAVVAERLIAVAGSAPREYGTQALSERGYDVERLYRGALVTLNREVDRAPLERALGTAPVGGRAPALARLEKAGPEAWAARIHALSGLADTAQRAAIPALLAATKTGIDSTKRAALTALAQLARRTACDPCGGQLCGFGGGSSEWSRSVRSLDRSCETKLPTDESDRIARELLPLLDDQSPEVREEAARTLGWIGSPVALVKLRAATRDPAQAAGYRVCESTDSGIQNCRVPFIVREAAQRAIEQIQALERAE